MRSIFPLTAEVAVGSLLPLVDSELSPSVARMATEVVEPPCGAAAGIGGSEGGDDGGGGGDDGCVGRGALVVVGGNGECVEMFRSGPGQRQPRRQKLGCYNTRDFTHSIVQK